MAFIKVEFGGKKKGGGYLRVDGGKQIKLLDGMVITVGSGAHSLIFSNKSGADRAISTGNALAGNAMMTYAMERDAVDGEITVNLDAKDMLFLTVVSNGSGKVISLPTYSIRELDDDEVALANQIANDFIAAKKKKTRRIVGIFLILVSLLGPGTFMEGGADYISALLIVIAFAVAGVLCLFWDLVKKIVKKKQ